MALFEKGFDGYLVLKGWFNSEQPTLSIFENKSQKAKVVPIGVKRYVDRWIKEGLIQREERLKKSKSNKLVYSSSTA